MSIYIFYNDTVIILLSINSYTICHIYVCTITWILYMYFNIWSYNYYMTKHILIILYVHYNNYFIS